MARRACKLVRSIALSGLVAASVVGFFSHPANAQTSPGLAPLPSTAAPTLHPKTGLQLTPEQRSRVFAKVTEQKDKVKAPPAGVSAAVGAELPASIELYTVPDDIMIEIPSTKLFKYTLLDGQVLMVDATSMRVVEVIRK